MIIDIDRWKKRGNTQTYVYEIRMIFAFFLSVDIYHAGTLESIAYWKFQPSMIMLIKP